MDGLRRLCLLPLAAMLAAAAQAPLQGAVSENLLANSSFAGEVGQRGLPAAWLQYGGGGTDQQIRVVELGEGFGVMLQDGDPSKEIGLTQTVAAKPGLTYEASVEARAVENASPAGAYLQLRFQPSDHFAQVSIAPTSTEQFERLSVKATAPPDTARATVYLYTHRDPTPQVLLRNVQLVSGVDPPPPPPPAPVPPVYTKLKDLHLTTHLVRAGRPDVFIIAPASGVYAEHAKRIQQAIERLTGVAPPIEADDSPAGEVPIRGNLIVLGNRSTNKTISELYNRYYTLLDLRYPGPGGQVVRTLHNPFGDGRNAILVGGSDLKGVDSASATLVQHLSRADVAKGALSVGRIADIQLGEGIRAPKELAEFETWEASKGYGSTGYFGWNSISKRMAMYYMTGEERHAREAIRLAFPDEQARREIAEIDGERIENKDEPLSGPYHYNAHMMILFWDLIEESPVFTDEERLRVTSAFAKQLDHRKGEGIYGRTSPPSAVGSRHGQWSAISLYCLGRYFQKDYPDPIWRHCMDSAMLHFQPLNEHAWVGGESDNLFWYNTGIAPIFTHLLLTGERKPLQNGVAAKLLRAQEMLISGRQPDWALNSASLEFLHKAAYLTQDGRHLAYRQRTGVDAGVFRLGQSFWPDERLTPRQPEDLAGRWSINELPKPMWRARGSGLAFDESFQFGSFRSASDASGDFILIDGFNGASRNPYHTFAVLELRLGGYTLLEGYHNQVLTRADGLVEPLIAMDAALKHRDVLGETATATGEVPNAAYCNWGRTLAQRIGRYCLVADRLAFRTDADNMEVQILWETENRAEAFSDGHLEFAAPIEAPRRGVDRGAQIWPSRPVKTTLRGHVAEMQWLGPVKKGDNRTCFSLIGMTPGAEKASLGCFQLAENAAALALPGPALAVVGPYEGVDADLAVVAGDHCFGRNLRAVRILGAAAKETSAGRNRRPGAPARVLISSQSPVDLDWDFTSGLLHVAASRETQLRAALQTSQPVRLNGEPVSEIGQEAGLAVFHLPPGRHKIEGAKLASAGWEDLASRLADLLVLGRQNRARAAAALAVKTAAQSPLLTTAMTANVGGPVTDLLPLPSEAGGAVYAAEGKTIHCLSREGKELQALEADGPVRMLRWWSEHCLLLAGCADEQVIAYDLSGKRKWVFTSEMDPAVFRAAKTYWFKSAPGHEGIHGLHTGLFLNGKSQAFVGSACTLEIIDQHGKLIRRMPQFWGKVSHFAIIDGPGGTLNLLASRKYNGTNDAAIINNQTLDPDPRGFESVPPGCTHVPGWSSMNRHHLFYEDLDGDGVKEVVSETNGTWNRVTVWRADGQPLYDASFGPGERIPARNMRDLDVADLDGDGRKEILAATSAGLVVALDRQCRKRWAVRLAGAPTVMKCVQPAHSAAPWIVIGCQDGAVEVLDGKGTPVRSAKVQGSPTCIEVLHDAPNGPWVVLATDQGEVAAFQAAQ